MSTRTLVHVIESVPTSDGAGVKLRRSLGSQRGLQVDPFLMLDEFYSDNPDDYMAGFPAHPHRGFETVTYMLDGRMRHEDHLGNRGDLGPGDVQWMTAGATASSTPKCRSRARGACAASRLWLNLPSKEKMKPASLSRHSRGRDSAGGAAAGRGCEGHCRHARGRWQFDEWTGQQRRRAAQHGSLVPSTYGSARWARNSACRRRRATTRSSMRMKAAPISARPARQSRCRPGRQASCQMATASVWKRGLKACNFLLLAARPLREPVVQYGPFVMNTREEIEQALADYRDGRFASAA